MNQGESKQLTVICQLQTARSPLLIDEAAAWRYMAYLMEDLPDQPGGRAVAHYWHVQHQRNAVLRGIGRRLRVKAARWLRFVAATRAAGRAK